MTRAFPVSQPNAPGEDPQAGDWQALRGELVALLDQVEGQYAQTATGDPAFAGFAQRMRDLRYQVADGNPDDRRREALRSVKRQVDRFNERGEAETIPHGDNVLQSAIQQIRARTQGEAAARPAPAAATVAAPAAQPRFDDLAHAVSGLTGRLGQLEAELGAQRGNASQVREIADQVSQLSQVVELLAGAVGESGQVKRLESQIAGLGQLIGQGPKVDLTQLTERLDQVSATVDRLADLQVQQIQHVVREAEAAPHKDADVAKSMQAIESGVRNIYDRIDALESSVALPPAELERIGEMLGQISGRIGSEGARPDRLLGLVDALHGRVNEIEDRGQALSGLMGDIDGLRDAVMGAMEPRFAAIESQLGVIGDKLDSQGNDGPSMAQIEAQIRLLVARMDQTGEQLSTLATLQSAEPALPDFEALLNAAASRTAEAMARSMPPRQEVPALPDLNALADLVAARTGEVLAQRPQMPAAQLEAIADIVATRTNAAMAARAKPTGPEQSQTLSETTLAEIETRISRLVEGFVKARPPEGESGMREGISRVEDRLAQLEASLLRDAAERRPMPQLEAERPLVPTAAMPEESVASLSDSMPRNPAADAPLKEFGFPDLGPVRAALEAKNGPRKPQAAVKPATDDAAPDFESDPITPEIASGGIRSMPPAEPTETAAPPAFDPAKVARPPRPESSLDTVPESPFAATPNATAALPAPDAVTPSTRNTFIEAARRAAQRQNTKTAPADTDSLIGRAMSRFQPGSPAAAAAIPEPLPAPKAAKPPKDKAATRGKSLFARKSKAVEAPIPHVEEAAPLLAEAPEMVAEKRNVGGESLLTRYRKPILIGASLIAVSFMTLNLVMQRLSADDGAASSNTTATPKAAIAGKPAAAVPAKPVTPPAAAAKPASDIVPSMPAAPTSVIVADAAPAVPHTDPIATASIGPDALPYAATPDAAPMPLAPATTNAATPAAPVALDSPVTVELPPEAIGPLDLRQSAADGDARSQFEIAAIYSEGRAVPQDFKQAAVWYERAAAQGFAPAQYRLGNLYETGKGGAKDYEQARLWYQRAAEAGNRMAMHNLAALYAGGQFGKQDFPSAANWFQQAADRGMKDSQFNLGMLYARGLGVPQSLEASYKWFGIAALSGDADAAKARDNVARSLDAETLKKATAEVAAWKPAAIDLAANFAPIGTWEKSFNPGPAITAKDVVLKVQTALARLGYDVGTPDGHTGPKTTIAIKAFEEGTGMTEVGAINPRLLAVLGSQPV